MPGRIVASADEAAFIVDLASGTSTKVDVGLNSDSPRDRSGNPRISADGSTVAFDYYGDPGCPGRSEIWLSTDGQANLISLPAGGTASSSRTTWVQDITPDGRFVLFRSRTIRSDQGQGPGAPLYVHDMALDVTTALPVGPSPTAWAYATMSDEGQRVAYPIDLNTAGSVQPAAAVYNRTTNVTVVPTIDDRPPTLWPNGYIRITADGRRIVFSTISPDGQSAQIVRADLGG